MNNLLSKYNLPVPRYTSYPTMPNWHELNNEKNWITAVKESYDVNKSSGISLYIHLPFCESLCTYCGCNKKITTNHNVEEDYIKTILKEWNLYLDLLHEPPLIRELHLGGGTPTFFSAKNLAYLLSEIFKSARIHQQHDFSIEGHPNNTTEEHIKTLATLGFKRISFGVQDNDATVQRTINRIQPFENVIRVTELARNNGFESVNFDLIYGLPHQTIPGISKTITECVSLKPDRVAFYSYAHVPWTSRAQRLFDENDLPSAEEKLQLYKTGKDIFLANGYSDIGMDHFALPTDSLYKAWQQKKMHRNFMGYTTQHTNMLIGLGVSSISDVGSAFAQNHKTLADYHQSIEQHKLAVVKGYFLSETDKAFKKYILNISCQGETDFNAEHLTILQQYTFPKLRALQADKLITWNNQGLQVTDLGRNFIRNICSAFDLYLQQSETIQTQPKFSKAI